MENLIHYQLLAGMGLLGVALGVTAARSHFCTLGAIVDWTTFGNTDRLRAWLLAMAVALGGVTLLHQAGLIDMGGSFPNYRSPAFNGLRHVLGGLMFGIGMTLASGCIQKNLVRLGGGNFKSLLVLLLAGGAAYVLSWTEGFALFVDPWLQVARVDLTAHGFAGQGLDQLVGGALGDGLGLADATALRSLLGGVASMALTAAVFRSATFRAEPAAWGSGLLVGLLVVAAWWLTAGALGQDWWSWAEMAETPPLRVAAQSFTFVSPLADLGRMAGAGNGALASVGVAGAIGVMVGSCGHAVFTGQWRVEWFANGADLRNHVLGALLMGAGGVLAMGCTIGQGVTGISTLSLGSLLSLLAIMAGSLLTLKLQYRLL